jgi:hypothetical protein
VRTFGTLAQEVMDAGVAGVVAMRYNVYVVTAAQFVADLYAELVRGQTLGAAVTMGRKQLATNPARSIAYDPRPLQDWCVPVVYESLPIRLFPVKKKANGLTITIQAGDTTSGRGTLDKELPRPPDAGFFGRDETLLALDRAFDTQKIVLLHAYAGSGKTTAAAEFACWYSLTGGITGPVLFTSFEQYKPLARVLDRIGEVFGPMLEQAGVHWLALDEATRRQVALDVLRQIPVLWIWDNVEPIAGFPRGTPSTWSGAEQKELADFLRDARSTQAKYLLTSRREEQDFLGDLPRRIPVPAMPMQERVQLARALAEKHGRRITDVDDWRPLLRFTEGNPLTITVLVGQSLRDGLRTKDQIDDFVTKLRTGTAKFDDEASEGRTRSLGASLSYGFDHAFSEAERKQLALLHFFQGFVGVRTLMLMGAPDADWCLPEMCGLTKEAGIALLGRAAEVGLLTRVGDGYYAIHPTVPWFFKNLFDAYYAGSAPGTPEDHPGSEDPQGKPPMRAFVGAMGELGNYCQQQYIAGNRDVIAALAAEEANLLHARRLARQKGWWRRVTSTMQGLRSLYGHTGRGVEWKALVDEIVPELVDPDTDGPRPGHEDNWNLVTEYRVRLARDVRDWAKAERLQRVGVEWNRRSAEDVLSRHTSRTHLPETTDETGVPDSERPSPLLDEPAPFRDRLAAVLPSLSDTDRVIIHNLAASLHELGLIQWERRETVCIASYEEALGLSEQIGFGAGAASCALDLGSAYMVIPTIRSLDQAEHWYRRSLELRHERDRLGRGQCQNNLGFVSVMRFRDARNAGEPKATLLAHLKAAIAACHEALELTPEDAVNARAATHHHLGSTYGEAGDIDRALPHFRESIRLNEESGNTHVAAQTRHNVAVTLARSGRLVDARDYALAALNDFATFGDAAADEVQQTQELIKEIDEDIAGTKG